MNLTTTTTSLKRLALLAILLWGSCSSPPASDDAAVIDFQRAAGTGQETDKDQAASRGISTAQLSLQQSIDLVLVQNPSLTAAAARIDQAITAIEESRAAIMPQLNLDVSYMRADAPSAFLFKTIDARGYVPGTDFNNPGAFSNWEVGLGVSYNLYSGGFHGLNRDIAGLQQRGAELDMAATQNNLVGMTINLWFAALTARDHQRLAIDAVATVQAQLNEAQVLFDEGKVLRSDVLSLQVRLAESQEMVIRSAANLKIARIGLARLLDSSERELPPLKSESNELTKIVAEPTDLAAALAAAFEQRPELEQLRVAIQQSELQIEQAASSSKPRVDLFGKAWADNPEIDFADSEANWSIGVAATWNMFDGGARSARRARAKARLAETYAHHRAMLSTVRNDVEVAYLALGTAEARLQVARDSVEFATESLRLVNAQYTEGVATITRFLEAEQMSTAAGQRLNQASYDHKRALADLARAMGAFTQAD